MSPVDGFWDNMFIAANNIVNVCFILVILKSVTDEFMVSLEDTKIQFHEMLPLLTGLITLIVQVSRLCVNIGKFPNAKPLIDLKEDFHCNQFNLKQAYHNFIGIDHVIFWGSLFCIFIGMFSNFTLIFNMKVRLFTVFKLEENSCSYSAWSRILEFGGMEMRPGSSRNTAAKSVSKEEEEIIVPAAEEEYSELIVPIERYDSVPRRNNQVPKNLTDSRFDTCVDARTNLTTRTRYDNVINDHISPLQNLTTSGSVLEFARNQSLVSNSSEFSLLRRDTMMQMAENESEIFPSESESTSRSTVIESKIAS